MLKPIGKYKNELCIYLLYHRKFQIRHKSYIWPVGKYRMKQCIYLLSV